MPEGYKKSIAVERDPQAVADDHFQHAHMLLRTAWWRPDLTALRWATTRIVVGAARR